jgi:glucose-6-phosphate isomerase
MTLLFGQLDAFTCGQLLAMYEHRVFVQVNTTTPHDDQLKPGNLCL